MTRWTGSGVGPATFICPVDRVPCLSVRVLRIRITEILADEEGGADVVKKDVHAVTTLPVVSGRGMDIHTRGVKDRIPAIVLLDKMAGRVERRAVVRERYPVPYRLTRPDVAVRVTAQRIAGSISGKCGFVLDRLKEVGVEDTRTSPANPGMSASDFAK